MSKERLDFDLERETKRLKEIVDKDDRLTISSRFMKYFIEQTERLQELEEDYKVRQVEYLEEHIDRLEQQNKRYKRALDEIYSHAINFSYIEDLDMKNYDLFEFASGVSFIAQKALGGESE